MRSAVPVRPYHLPYTADTELRTREIAELLRQPEIDKPYIVQPAETEEISGKHGKILRDISLLEDLLGIEKFRGIACAALLHGFHCTVKALYVIRSRREIGPCARRLFIGDSLSGKFGRCILSGFKVICCQYVSHCISSLLSRETDHNCL